MNRYAACIEYCGKNYNGWQHQPHAPSVQDKVEAAISKVADQHTRVVACGRTDTGVHASGQIIHFDTSVQRSNYQWTRGINTYLPDDISLIWSHPVSLGFHARFGAINRSYRYIILNRQVSPSYLSGLVTWHRAALDPVLMQRAAQSLLGEHDFSAYRAAGCQNRNPVKHVTKITIGVSGSWLWFDLSANGFLHHMVRNIVGVLCTIGEGEEEPGWAVEVLGSKDRTQGGVTAPAAGLYFASARYDPAFRLPEPPQICQFW
jgi:tRNA pseudouridine38-40 synthase